MELKSPDAALGRPVRLLLAAPGRFLSAAKAVCRRHGGGRGRCRNAAEETVKTKLRLGLGSADGNSPPPAPTLMLSQEHYLDSVFT